MFFSVPYTSAMMLLFAHLMSHDLASAAIVLTCPLGTSQTNYFPGVTYRNSTSEIKINGTQYYMGCTGTKQITSVYVTIDATGPTGTSCTTLFSIKLHAIFYNGSTSAGSIGSDALLSYNGSSGLFPEKSVYVGQTNNNQGPFPLSSYKLTYSYDSIGAGLKCLLPSGLEHINGKATLEVADNA